MPIRAAVTRGPTGTIVSTQPARVWGRVALGCGLATSMVALLALATGQRLPGLTPLGNFLWFGPLGLVPAIVGFLALGNRQELHFGAPRIGMALVVRRLWIVTVAGRYSVSQLRGVRILPPPRATIHGYKVGIERIDGQVMEVDQGLTAEEAWSLAARVSEAAWNLETTEIG